MHNAELYVDTTSPVTKRVVIAVSVGPLGAINGSWTSIAGSEIDITVDTVYV